MTKACEGIDLDLVSLEDINKILNECVVYKMIAHRPIKFWTFRTQKSCQITKQGSKSDRESKKEQRGHERPIRKIQKGQDQIQEDLSTSEEKI